MKKLMTMIGAAAAAFGLYAADPAELNIIGFEAGEPGVTEAGEPLDLTAKDDYDQLLWYKDSEAEVEATVTAYEESPAENNLNYLKLEADTPLYRTIAPVSASGLVPVAIEDEDADRGGIIADQRVQFSAFDTDTTVELEDGAKIAVWLKTLEEGPTEEENTYALMVTCGKLDESWDPTETPVQLDLGDIEVKPNEWHQLTITAIKAIDFTEFGAVAGFTVKVDGVLAKAAKDEDALFPENWADNATEEAKKLIPDGQLFPSAVGWTSGASMLLQGIAYKGTGAVDDIVITAKEYDPPAPATFAIAKEPSENGSYTVTVGGAEVTEAVEGAEVTVTATANQGYELDEIKVVDEEGDPVEVLVGVFTMPAKAVTVEVTFKEVPTDPIPPLPDDPQPGDVEALVQKIGFKDAGVAELIGDDATMYAAFKLWAKTVIGDEQAVVDSEHSADSFQLGLEELLENDPVSEIKTIAKDGDTMTFKFEIKDGKEGDAVAVAQAAADYVKTLVKCNEKVDFGTDTEIKANVTVEVEDTTLTATVELPAGKESAFMKVAK